MSILSVKNLSAGHGGRDIIRDISADAGPGVTMLLGQNGCGKSTFIKAITGNLTARGQVFLDGEDILSLSVRARARKIAYLPQRQVWDTAMTVRDYVSMGAGVNSGIFSPPDKKAAEKADFSLEMLGITPLAEKSMNRLSGGEARLAGIARAVAQGGKFLIMDEPMAGLDFRRAHEILGIIRKKCPDSLISIHDPAMAWQYGDSVLLMDGGKIIARGRPGDGAIFEDSLRKIYGENIAFAQVHGKNLPMWRDRV